jgi:hypothetical protein
MLLRQWTMERYCNLLDQQPSERAASDLLYQEAGHHMPRLLEATLLNRIVREPQRKLSVLELLLAIFLLLMSNIMIGIKTSR